MTTEVTICNSALLKLGANTITSLSDNSKEAELCNEQYAKIRDELLYSFSWNFAVKSAALTDNGNNHLWDDDLPEFDIPADYLRMVEVEQPDYRWYVENGKIYYESTVLNCRYIYQVTDVTKFSAGFIELLSTKLALELSYSLVQSASLKETLKKDYNLMLRDMRSFDSQEGYTRQLTNEKFLQVRN